MYLRWRLAGKGPLPRVRPQDEDKAGLPACRRFFRPSQENLSGARGKKRYIGSRRRVRSRFRNPLKGQFQRFSRDSLLSPGGRFAEENYP